MTSSASGNSPINIHVFSGKIEVVPQEQYYRSLSDSEQDHADAILNDQDRSTFIFCRARLRQILSDFLTISPKKILIEFGVHGKPFIRDSGLYFSVSHADGIVAIAVTQAGQIGIDIELKGREFDYDKLVDMLFSAKEKEQFVNCNAELRHTAFLNCWTAKEAFFKALGCGLSAPLKDLEIDFIPGKRPQILRTGWDEKDKEMWTIQSIDFIDDIIGAVAVKRQSRLDIIHHTMDSDFRTSASNRSLA